MNQCDRDFTLRQLRTFLCAARLGSFSRAANELGISQPAVSDQIAMLEDRLGHSLFVRRQGTTPTLTPEGRKLLEKAGHVVETSEAMHSEERPTLRERVRLSIGPRLRDVYYKPVLPRIYRQHPRIRIELMPVIPLPDIQAALDQGRVDLVVYTVGHMGEPWPNVRLVTDVPTVMVGPAGSRARLRAGTESLEDMRFILPTIANVSEQWIETQLQILGLNPRKPVLYLEFTDVIQEMVEDGQGVTVLMYEQVASSIAQGRLEVIGPGFPPMKRFIARSDTAPAAARVIEDHLMTSFTEPATSARRSGAAAPPPQPAF